ncbi:MAG: hypothetical protein B6D46_06030 [Polyangiaceae bacterium UTPRO1]|jgi:hypothetical protein|nr:hypothetical protein [Myxococcales bacterium]OQY67582.1 MAG: hypothetical protein B6D46_06030 [Polyangiaceae bacterium UTPRO1]
MPIERGCDLCAAARLTRWYFADDVCWVADCEVCAVPMVVWRRHGIDPPAHEVAHMTAALERAAAAVFPAWVIDGQRRNIPDHWHAHARPSGKAALAWWMRRR